MLPKSYKFQNVIRRCETCKFSHYIDDINFGYKGLVCTLNTSHLDYDKHDMVDDHGFCDEYKKED